MVLHQFSVGLLTELATHQHLELLGLNINNGQASKLRLRADRSDGFRLCSDIRRVLCHEFAHMSGVTMITTCVHSPSTNKLFTNL